MPPPLLDKEFSIQKVSSAVDLIDRLLAEKFAYQDAKEALEVLKTHFQKALRELEEISAEDDHEILVRACWFANSQVDLYKDFMGMVLRSNSVLNAFEIYTALKGIAARLLDEPIRVVIGSEFNFIPFIYPEMTSTLRDFIFIGLPASEGQNALLIPIAAHELGHAVWRKKGVNTRFSRMVTLRLPAEIQKDWAKLNGYFPPGTKPDDVAKHRKLEIWKLCWNFSSRQAEEIFCDLVAYWVFGKSYAYSFRYLLAPGMVSRTGNYPSDRIRAKCIADFANLLEDDIDPYFLAAFPNHGESSDVFISVADRLVASLVDSLQQAAIAHCQGSGLERPTKQQTDEVLKAFRHLAPAPAGGTTADIVNAGWALRINLDNWAIKGVSPDRKLYILSDLVYKSLEVLEWETLNRSL